MENNTNSNTEMEHSQNTNHYNPEKKYYKTINQNLTNIFIEINIKKYFRTLNDQLFIYDIDTGIFKRVSSNQKLRNAQFKFLLPILREYFKKNNLCVNIKNKSLVDKIIDKILLNPHIYSTDIRNEYFSKKICIPLQYKKCFNDTSIALAKTNYHLISSTTQELKPKYSSLFYLNNYNNINNESYYLEFLKYLNNSNSNLYFYTKKLVENLYFNCAILNPSCFFIEYETQNILDLYLKPILAKIPSEFISYYSLDDLNKSKKIIDLTNKRVNLINKISKLTKSHNEILDNFIFNQNFRTIDSKNVKNTSTFILCGSNEDFSNLCKISTKFKNSTNYLRLPSDIAKEYYDPDYLDLLLSDSYSIFNLLLCKFNKSDDEPNFAIAEGEKISSFDSLQAFWNDCIEITGSNTIKDSDKDLHFILKDCLYSEYQSYCNKHALTPVANNIVGKIIASFSNFDANINLHEFRKIPKDKKIFTSGKHPKFNKNCYYGIRLKIYNEDS